MKEIDEFIPKNQNDLKICVYAICKNESKFVDRWINSLKEADCIVVLDTGSTDNTVELLEHYSPFVTVKSMIIDPWRFDTARNESMKLIPNDADICVVSDLDQVFVSGWANELRKLFSEGYEEIYGPIIDYDENNVEEKRFLSKNVHPNNASWYWERPIHEGIYYHGEREIKTITSNYFIIEHHQDKSKPRGQYLDLLRSEYLVNRKDPYCAIYYGCELCFHDMMDEGLQVFLDGIKECDFSKTPEIGYQMYLNMADEYNRRERYQDALEYVYSAFRFNVITRRLYMALADNYFALKDYENTVKYCFEALEVRENVQSWIETDYYFKGGVYDTIALAYFYDNRFSSAISYGYLAVKEDPENERFKNNLNFYVDRLRELIEK